MIYEREKKEKGWPISLPGGEDGALHAIKRPPKPTLAKMLVCLPKNNVITLIPSRS
jgi:hypothetical protein